MTDVSIKKLIESKQPIYIISKTVGSGDIRERYGDHASVVDLLNQNIMSFVSIDSEHQTLQLVSKYDYSFFIIVNDVKYKVEKGSILVIQLEQEAYDDFMNNWYNRGKY